MKLILVWGFFCCFFFFFSFYRGCMEYKAAKGQGQRRLAQTLVSKKSLALSLSGRGRLLSVNHCPP